MSLDLQQLIHDPCRSVCNSCRTQGFRPMGFNFLSQRVTNVALPDPQKKQSVAKYDDLPRKKHITDTVRQVCICCREYLYLYLLQGIFEENKVVRDGFANDEQALCTTSNPKA